MSYQSMLEVMELVGNANQAKEAKKGSKNRIRKCLEIGLFVLDRSCKNCVFHTSFCAQHCYCLKQYVQYPDMIPSDAKNEAFWKALTPKSFKLAMGRKRTHETRFRFATRGEMLSNLQDLKKVRDIALECPDIEFWLPTRAWRSDVMRWAIKHYLQPLPNVHVLASVDPSNLTDAWETADPTDPNLKLDMSQVEMLASEGFSIMFFGWDHQPLVQAIAKASGFEYVACSKTWEHKKAACRDCDNGCFQTHQKRVFIHLKQH